MGLSKDYFGTTALIRVIYELYCLKKPTDTLGLGRGEIISIVPISHTKEAAQRVVFEGITRKLFLSPFWKGRFEVTKEEIRFPGKDIVIVAGGSNEGAALGLNVWSALLDEGNFMGKHKKDHVSAGGGKEDKSESIYDSLRRRIRGTYAAKGLRGRLFLVSSKKSIHDFTERRIREAMKENDTSVFVRDYATWDVRPNAFEGQKWWRAAVSQTIGRVRVLEDHERPEEHEIWFKFPEEYLRDFKNDPAGAARDIAGIALESFRPFFSNREAINEMMKAERAHPFHVYEWRSNQEIKPIWENLVMKNVHGDPVARCCPNAHRHAHLDLSKNRDATGFCVGHAAGEVEVTRLDPETHERKREEAPLIHIDLCLRILPPVAGEIEHQVVRSLVYMLREGGLPIRSVSADRWMGLPNLQLISQHGFKTEEISTQRTLDPYLAAQSALYERRIESPIYKLLAKELRELELNEQGTKVDHPKTGCFTGDTKVRLLDGRSLSFEQLVDEFGDGRVFYTYTIRDGKVSVGAARNPRLTQRNADIVCVTLDSGAKIRCTPDHRFMLRDGTYREAKDLQPDDSLMPLYTKLSNGRSHDMVGYELYSCPSDGRWHYTHRMVGRWKYPDRGYTGNQFGNGIIHHERGKLNNDPQALKWVADSAAHALEHREDLLRRRADPVFEAKRLAGLEAYNNAPESKNEASKRFKATLARPDVFEKTQLARSKTGKATGKKNITAYNKSAAHREAAARVGKVTIYKAIDAIRRDDVSIDKIIELRAAGATLCEIARTLKCDRTLVSRRLKTAKLAGVDVPAPRNHKVVSVESAGRADVYDITVAETENFALDVGVFVHNSKDLSDAFAAVVYYLSKNWRQIGVGGVSKGMSQAATGVPGVASPTSDGNFRWPDEPPPLTEGGEDFSGLPTWII